MRDGAGSLAGVSLAGTMRDGPGAGTEGDRLADGVSRDIYRASWTEYGGTCQR